MIQRGRKRERERKSILCRQPYTTLLSMIRGQSVDEPTAQTREGEKRTEGRDGEQTGA